MVSTPSSFTNVTTPSAPRELAEILGETAARGSSVAPVGGGTKQGYGNPLTRRTELLSTKALDRILAYEPDDMTLSVEAGATIGSVWNELKLRGQTIPIDVPQPELETIGGLIATGLCGPRRYGSGSLRDALIGIQVAYPDATLGNAGGMVVKNVSGFDLMRMHLGALGTLGVIVSANFKVIPAARAEATVIVERETVTDLERDRRTVGGGRIHPIAFEARQAGTIWRESIRIEGRPATVDQMALELADALGGASVLATEESKQHWRNYVASEALPAAQNSLVLQARGKPSDLRATLATTTDKLVEAGAHLEDVRAGIGLGTVRVVARVDDNSCAPVARAIQALRTTSCSALILATPEAMRGTVDVFGTPESTLELMRPLKLQFDPKSVLNPGRVIPEL